MNCKYCSREIKNKGSLKAHEMCCKDNPDKITHYHPPTAGAKKGSIPWNQGKIGVQVGWNKGIKGSTTGKGSTPELEELRKQKIKEKAKISNGGYRQGSGRGKKGWYKGFFCDSSWELAYVIYCLDHGIDIKRNTEKRKYIFNEKLMTYIPDFIVDGLFVEIKGYKTEQWMAKLQANPDIKVLYEQDLKDIINYVSDKYGTDYIKLYGR